MLRRAARLAVDFLYETANLSEHEVPVSILSIKVPEPMDDFKYLLMNGAADHEFDFDGSGLLIISFYCNVSHTLT